MNEYDPDEYFPLWKMQKKQWVESKDGHRFFFDHVDGMYSYCREVGGGISHYSANLSVKRSESQT